MYDQSLSGSPAWFISQMYFYTSDSEIGFLWLERSYDRHEVEMTWLKVDPLLKPFRDHPDLQEDL